MITMSEKKCEKVMDAAEKYSLNFIKNATLKTIKKSELKDTNTKCNEFNKKINYSCW